MRFARRGLHETWKLTEKYSVFVKWRPSERGEAVEFGSVRVARRRGWAFMSTGGSESVMGGW